MKNDEFVFDVSYAPEIKAIIAETGSVKDLFHEPDSPLPVGKWTIAPWGDDNQLPTQVMEMIEKSELVSSNLNFNIRLAYAQGIKPVLKVMDGKKAVYEPCEDQRVLDFFEANDIQGYFLEQCTDMETFFNVFPEIIINKGRTEIVMLRHKEAVFSRWGIADKKKMEIRKHYYGDWTKTINEETVTETEVLSRFNTVEDLRDMVKKSSISRFIIPISFPTPGKVYYQRPPYWSIFRSGSYDFSTMIWEFKKALLKNGLRVRYIIYVSKKYWEKIFQEENIDQKNPDAVKARKDAEILKFKNFLSADKNHGNGLMATKEMIPSGSTAIEEKYITIETVKSDIKGGEYLEDSSEVSSMISYAMDVHQNLIATSPGKNPGSMSGTDKRELFMIKSAMKQPFRDRLLRPLYVVKAFNQWPSNLEFQVADFQFTTLDQNKTGKELSTQNPNPEQK